MRFIQVNQQMKIKDLSSFKKDEVMSLLGRVPFYRELQQAHPDQLEKILGFSCIVELEPGEVIMRRGDRGSWLYCLIKGSLVVYFDDPSDAQPLNTITPGEVFGDLALLCDHERKATVAAGSGERKVLLFATDFKPFGDLSNFTTIDLKTKLIFYRTMVHSIRWRLEVHRMAEPGHPLAQELLEMPLIREAKGSVGELEGLFQQARFLADLLDRWNGEDNRVVIEDVVVATINSRV